MKYKFIIIVFMFVFANCESTKDSSTNNYAMFKEKLHNLIERTKNEYRVRTYYDISKYRYTLQFTKTFIDSSYLLLMNPFGGINDFFEKDGKTYIRASSKFPTIYFEMECDKEIFYSLFTKMQKNQVLFIIKINNIKKMFLAANPENDGENNYIDLNLSSAFVASGKLISYKLIE